ncbi:hypothetical protein PPIS_b1181 [Pseudoalteromonas piscicida]|uniref:Uncharacterized protein n=1 Tax=Pseudoalteromonas piscicida TaxID=43662 RepID=A0ABN5CN61_PSEO7|nr:hypothetical protein PPIS_b1181 [Pseudoalteromonas piscicida]
MNVSVYFPYGDFPYVTYLSLVQLKHTKRTGEIKIATA